MPTSAPHPSDDRNTLLFKIASALAAGGAGGTGGFDPNASVVNVGTNPSTSSVNVGRISAVTSINEGGIIVNGNLVGIAGAAYYTGLTIGNDTSSTTMRGDKLLYGDTYLWGTKTEITSDEIIIGTADSTITFGQSGGTVTTFRGSLDFSLADSVTGLGGGGSFDPQATLVYLGTTGNTYGIALGSSTTDVWCYGNFNVSSGSPAVYLHAQWNYIGKWDGSTAFQGNVDFSQATVTGLSGGGGGVDPSAAYTWTGTHTFNYHAFLNGTTVFGSRPTFSYGALVQVDSSTPPFDVYNPTFGNGLRFDHTGFYVGHTPWGGAALPLFLAVADSGQFFFQTGMDLDAGYITIGAGMTGTTSSIIIGHGSATMGFFGATPVNRPTITADATSIRSALIALGLCQ